MVYCDGGFFIGNCDKLLKFKDRLFYFWGYWIFDVFLDELFWKGFDSVFDIIVGGRLVGVFIVIIYVDYIGLCLWCVMNVFFWVFFDVGFVLDECVLNGFVMV